MGDVQAASYKRIDGLVSANALLLEPTSTFGVPLLGVQIASCGQVNRSVPSWGWDITS